MTYRIISVCAGSQFGPQRLTLFSYCAGGQFWTSVITSIQNHLCVCRRPILDLDDCWPTQLCVCVCRHPMIVDHDDCWPTQLCVCVQAANFSSNVSNPCAPRDSLVNVTHRDIFSSACVGGQDALLTFGHAIVAPDDADQVACFGRTCMRNESGSLLC